MIAIVKDINKRKKTSKSNFAYIMHAHKRGMI